MFIRLTDFNYPYLKNLFAVSEISSFEQNYKNDEGTLYTEVVFKNGESVDVVENIDDIGTALRDCYEYNVITVPLVEVTEGRGDDNRIA